MTRSGLHIMFVVEPGYSSELDWGRTRRDAAEQGAVLSLVTVSGGTVRWLFPAAEASTLPATFAIDASKSAADARAAAGVLDKLYEAQALIPSISTTEIKLLSNSRFATELTKAVRSEPTVRVEQLWTAELPSAEGVVDTFPDVHPDGAQPAPGSAGEPAEVRNTTSTRPLGRRRSGRRVGMAALVVGALVAMVVAVGLWSGLIERPVVEAASRAVTCPEGDDVEAQYTASTGFNLVPVDETQASKLMGAAIATGLALPPGDACFYLNQGANFVNLTGEEALWVVYPIASSDTQSAVRRWAHAAGFFDDGFLSRSGGGWTADMQWSSGLLSQTVIDNEYASMASFVQVGTWTGRITVSLDAAGASALLAPDAQSD